MTTLGSTTHHLFDYIELGAPDLPAAKSFYADVFGWGFNDYGPAYAGIVGPDGVGEVGGLDAGTTPTPDGVGPLVQLYSDDLEATAAAIVAAGGTITTPTYDFPGGRRFGFTDPAGNRLGVWTRG